MIDKALKTKVHTLLQDTVTLLLRNSIPYKLKINVEALIGVTIDEDDVVLININKSYEKDKPKTETKVDRSPKPSPKHQLKTPDRHHEIDAKKRKRSAGPHNSNDVSSMQQYYSDLAGSAKRKTNYKELGYVIKTEAPEEVLVSKSGKKGKNYNRFDSPIGYQPTPGDDLQVTGVSFAQNSGSPSNRVSFAPNKQLPTPVQIIPHGKMPTGKAGSPFKSPKYRDTLNCPVCAKTFRSKTGLQYHMQGHQGIYKYKCEKCDRGFQVLSHLKFHAKKCGQPAAADNQDSTDTAKLVSQGEGEADLGLAAGGTYMSENDTNFTIGNVTSLAGNDSGENSKDTEQNFNNLNENLNDFAPDGSQNGDSLGELAGITVIQPEAPPDDGNNDETYHGEIDADIGASNIETANGANDFVIEENTSMDEENASVDEENVEEADESQNSPLIPAEGVSFDTSNFDEVEGE